MFAFDTQPLIHTNALYCWYTVHNHGIVQMTEGLQSKSARTICYEAEY